MATKKETGTTKIERLHAAYLEAKLDPDAGIARALRVLAKRFGVPFSEADRAATVDGWEMERRARKALAWHREFGRGARTEEEFLERSAAPGGGFSHLAADGMEGVRLAHAHARDIWRRAMGPALEWEAACLLDEAREDYDAIQAVRKPLEAKRRERRAAGYAFDSTSPALVLREAA